MGFYKVHFGIHEQINGPEDAPKSLTRKVEKAQLCSKHVQVLFCHATGICLSDPTIDLGLNGLHVFDKNIKLANEIKPNVNFFKYKNESYKQLSQFIAQGKENFFDLIYIDGAHDSQNVLFDAVISFKLVKKGGVIIFDDYSWKQIINANISFYVGIFVLY